MDRAAAVELGRRAAEMFGDFPSAARVRRATGGYVLDAGGYEVPEWVDVLADTPCRIAGASRGAASSSTRDISGVEVETPNRTARFPHGTTGFADGDFIEVTYGDSSGLVFRIIEADQGDQQTAVRVPVEGVERPAEWGAA